MCLTALALSVFSNLAEQHYASNFCSDPQLLNEKVAQPWNTRFSASFRVNASRDSNKRSHIQGGRKRVSALATWWCMSVGRVLPCIIKMLQLLRSRTSCLNLKNARNRK